MARTKVDHKKMGIHDLRLCRECTVGSCCRDGVELDLLDVARILRKNPDVPKPWFRYLSRSKEFPSGFRFETMVRRRRCVFQMEDRRCAIYDVRPAYCREFPIEDGRRAPLYDYLCQRGKKRKKRKHSR